MTEARTLNVRLTGDDVEKLEALRKFYRVNTDSQAARILIREAVDRLRIGFAGAELGEEQRD